MGNGPAHTAKAKPLPRGLIAAALLVLVIGLVAVVAWQARRPIAEAYLTNLLLKQGVPASVQIDALDRTHALGRLRLGPATAPDASVERVEADYAIAPLFSAHPLAVTLIRARFDGLVVNARLANGHLSLGSLDGVVSHLRGGAPGGPSPQLIFNDATVRLQTPAGAMALKGAALVDHGRIERLGLSSGPASLQFGATLVQARSASLTAATTSGVTTADARIAVDRMSGPVLDLTGADVTLHLEGALQTAPLNLTGGRLTAALAAASLAHDRNRLAAPRASLQIVDLSSQLANGRLTAHGGVGTLTIDSAEATNGAASLKLAHVQAAIDHVDVAQAGRDIRLALVSNGQFSAPAGTANLALAPAGLSDIVIRWNGEVGLAGAAPTASLSASGSATAALSPAAAQKLADRSPVHAPNPSAPPLAAGLRMVRLSAPAVAISTQGRSLRLALGAPATVTLADGGRVTLAGDPAGPALFRAGASTTGAFAVSASGGALPDVALRFSHYAMGAAGFDSQVSGRAQFSLAFLRGADIRGDGRLRIGGGAARFDVADCLPAHVTRAEMGAVSVDEVGGQLCPTPGAPLLTVGRGWRLSAKVSDMAGTVPGWAAKFADTAGALEVGATGGPALGAITLARAEVTDISPSPRFRPLQTDGRLDLTASGWTGRFMVATAGGRPIGLVDLRHDPATSHGEALITAQNLTFAKGGLQPDDLSPLGHALSPVAGAASFNGRLAWGGDQAVSGGDLELDNLSLRSPAGAVTGLNGHLRFSSLFPLQTAPDQTLTAQKIDAFTPLTSAKATFTLTPDAIEVSAAEAGAAGGQVRLEPTHLALAAKTTAKGVLDLKAIDLGLVIAGSSLAEKVDINAVVDGRLPFALTPQGLRFDNGSITAIKPGRISIHRDALTKSPVTNAVQDFAFQALEALAFDELTAAIQSRPGGRLGVLFHIKGRYAPPTRQEANIPIADLLNGSALRSKIPLPSDTPVNLNLDTSLNFDQILQDYHDAFTFQVGQAQSGAPLHSAVVQR